MSDELPIFRRKTREIAVGSVRIGAESRISVQSMTTTKTSDAPATIAQIQELAAAGADIVRCTCNSLNAVRAFPEIVAASPVPVVADVHFRPDLAHEAIAAGAACVRLDPGNIRDKGLIQSILRHAEQNSTAVRIGVNSGSVDPNIQNKYGGPTSDALVESALQQIQLAEDAGVTNLKISVKSSSMLRTIAAYRKISARTTWPLHVGLTEAGPAPNGIVKSCVAIGALLLDGIGDTIRVSLTENPVDEVKVALTMLEGLGLRPRTTLDLIACPSCGRAEVDVIGLARKAQEALEREGLALTVAVMGCAVNGPGEAREADLGIAAGRGRGHLFVKGRIVRVVPEKDMINTLLEEARQLTHDGSLGSEDQHLPLLSISSQPSNSNSAVLVSAARAIIMTKKWHSVLLLRYVDPVSGSQGWGLPGGKLEGDESAMEAAIREVLEETSLRLSDGVLVGSYVNSYMWAGVSHAQHEQVYWFEVPDEVAVEPSQALGGLEGASYRDAKWWTISELQHTSEQIAPQGLGLLVSALKSKMTGDTS